MAPVDTTKLRELILYVTQKSEGDSHFGKTKMFKVLAEADFSYYVRTGRSITGETYIKREFGPVPRAGLAVLDELQGSGALQIIGRTYHGFWQEKPFAMRDPDLEQFSGGEIAVVDEAIERLWAYTAKDASDRSHESVGWIVANFGEEIPYPTALVNVVEPTEADFQHAAELIAAGRHLSPAHPLKTRRGK
jgi:hypothetical protein